jgi:ribosomal protein L22
VIKTLRNIFNGDSYRMMNNDEMQKAVKYLNNSINRTTQLAPKEMQTYPQLENNWINIARMNNKIKKLQYNEGLYDYKVGDILLICLDKNKANNEFYKKKRNFEYLGSFIDYVFGNVRVNLLDKNFNGKG